MEHPQTSSHVYSKFVKNILIEYPPKINKRDLIRTKYATKIIFHFLNFGLADKNKFLTASIEIPKQPNEQITFSHRFSCFIKLDMQRKLDGKIERKKQQQQHHIEIDITYDDDDRIIFQFEGKEVTTVDESSWNLSRCMNHIKTLLFMLSIRFLIFIFLY